MPILPTLLEALDRSGHPHLSQEHRDQLLAMSIATAALQRAQTLFPFPNELQGRVTSAYRLITSGLLALGQVLSGILLQQVGILWTVGFFAMCFVVMALGVTLNPHLRRVRSLT